MSNLSNNSGNNKREFWRWPLYILIAVGVLASLAVAGERLAAEAGSKTTLLSLEWGQLKDNAARNGCTVEEALQKLTKDEAGRPLVSGVVYKEPMLIDWQNGGYLQVQTGSQLLNDVRIGGWEIVEPAEAEDLELSDLETPQIDNNHNYVLCYDEEQQQLVYNNLQYKTSAQNQLYTMENAEEEQLFVVGTTYPYTDLTSLGIGFSAEEARLIQSFGSQLA